MLKKLPLLAFFLVPLLLAAPMAAHAESHAAPEGEGVPAAPKINYLDVPVLIMPMFEGRQAKKYLAISLQLEIALTANAEEIKTDMPRIRDALLVAAYVVGKDNPNLENVDLEKIRGHLLAAVQECIGAEKVTGLFFTGTREIKA